MSITYYQTTSVSSYTKDINYQKLQDYVPYPLSWSQAQDEEEDMLMIHRRFAEILKDISHHEKLLESYKSYCHQEDILPDIYALRVVDQIKNSMDDLITQHHILINKQTKSTQEHFNKVVELDQIYRSLLNLQTPAARLLSRSTQTYRSSKVAQFFDGAKSKKEAVNYDRVQSRRVTEIEQQLLNIYELDSDKVNLLMSSSGTAAYTIIEKYLLLNVVKRGDKVLIVPSMYDELQGYAFRQLPYLTVITEDFFATDDIVACIHKHKPKIVFIDPLKNMQDARMTDIIAVIKQLATTWTGDDLFLIIDETMLSAAVNPFVAASKNTKLKIMLFCSCVKYLQIGQDTSMSGLLAFPAELNQQMKDIRLFLGTVFNDTLAWSYPHFDREFYIWRMQRMTRNALVMSEVFKNTPTFTNFFLPVYPALPDHPDHAISKQFSFAGGSLHLRFLLSAIHSEENLLDILHEMILQVINQAKTDGTSLAWGETFGFDIPRIQVLRELLVSRCPPFLRISVGDKSLKETEGVAISIARGLTAYVEKNKDRLMLKI